MATNKKPLGLTATAIYSGFSGLIYLPIGFLLLLASQAPEGGGLFTAVGVLMCVLGVFMLACVYGLWSLQAWGRVLALWLSGISILLGAVSIFPIWPDQQFSIANAVLQLVGIGIAILIMTYLSKFHVKALFDNQ